jgi:hypothetical protein
MYVQQEEGNNNHLAIITGFGVGVGHLMFIHASKMLI